MSDKTNKPTYKKAPGKFSGKRRPGTSFSKAPSSSADSSKKDTSPRKFPKDRGRKNEDVATDEPKKEPLTLLQPVSWSPKGEAVIMEGNKRFLLWGGIPNEKALFRSVHKGQNQDILEFVGTKTPHSTRITPICEHYTRCGGCPFMHMRDVGQHNAKLSLLHKHLAKKGLLEHAPSSIYSDMSLRFRHQTKLVVTSEEGSLQVGVRNRRNDVASIPNCEVITKQLKLLNKRLAHKIIEMSKGNPEDRIYAYEGEGKPGLRYVVMRQSLSNQGTHVCFVATHPRKSYQQLAEWLMTSNIPISGVSLHINTEEGNAIFSKNNKGQIAYELLRGTETIEETVNGITYEIGPGDFFQVNPRVAGKLQEDLLVHARRFADHPMVDLYCGVGFFSLALSKEFNHVIGIEGVEGSIIRARNNAINNQLKAEFFAGVVDDVLDDNIAKLNRPFVVVDPARRGLESFVIDSLHQHLPCAIAYISCSPRSFAEDIADFVSRGWKVSSMQAYDMIPNSAHVEMMALLEPSESLQSQFRKPRRKIVG